MYKKHRLDIYQIANIDKVGMLYGQYKKQKEACIKPENMQFNF